MLCSYYSKITSSVYVNEVSLLKRQERINLGYGPALVVSLTCYKLSKLRYGVTS